MALTKTNLLGMTMSRRHKLLLQQFALRNIMLYKIIINVLKQLYSSIRFCSFVRGIYSSLAIFFFFFTVNVYIIVVRMSCRGVTRGDGLQIKSVWQVKV